MTEKMACSHGGHKIVVAGRQERLLPADLAYISVLAVREGTAVLTAMHDETGAGCRVRVVVAIWASNGGVGLQHP